jgi:IS605 OrfB family transposase
MSKCEKGSNNRKKLNKQLNKIYTKIRNRKIDNLHKITTQLVKENQIISIEDLDVSEMLSNHKLAKAIQEMNFYEFRVLLDYKCIKYNRNLMIVDRYFPSTKKCSGCGHINHNMTLSDRVFICPICGLIINRDKNASINIDKEGVRLYNNPDEYTKVLEKRKERNQKNLETTIVKSEVKKKEKTLKKKNKNITPNKGKGGVSTC